MFLAVILGYLVAALFAFCGIANICIFLSSAKQGMGAQHFIEELSLAAWPLAVAAIVYLLTQLAILLEQQSIVAVDLETEKDSPHSKETDVPKRPAPLPAGSYFHAEPAPRPTPPQLTPTLPQNTPAATPPTEAPSIAEVENIATAAAEEAAREEAEPAADIKPIIKRRNDGLNFFRVD